jgi:hypothetical protein
MSPAYSSETSYILRTITRRRFPSRSGGDTATASDCMPRLATDHRRLKCSWQRLPPGPARTTLAPLPPSNQHSTWPTRLRAGHASRRLLCTGTEELGVGTEIRWRRKPLRVLQPIATYVLVATGDAVGARFIPGRTLVNTRGDGRIDANAPHHAIHQLGLTKNPVEHRPAIARTGHFTPPLLTCLRESCFPSGHALSGLRSSLCLIVLLPGAIPSQ